MNRDQLTALLAQANSKRKFLETKIVENQAVPKWLQTELNFVADYEAMATGLFASLEREKKHEEMIKRLTELINLMECAFGQLMKNKPGLVHFTGRVEALHVGTEIFFYLASLMPDGCTKQHTLQFYYEYTNELLTGRPTAAQRDRANQINSTANSNAVSKV